MNYSIRKIWIIFISVIERSDIMLLKIQERSMFMDWILSIRTLQNL